MSAEVADAKSVCGSNGSRPGESNTPTLIGLAPQVDDANIPLWVAEFPHRSLTVTSMAYSADGAVTTKDGVAVCGFARVGPVECHWNDGAANAGEL